MEFKTGNRLEVLETRMNESLENKKTEINVLMNATAGICENEIFFVCGGNLCEVQIELAPKENCNMYLEIDSEAFANVAGCYWSKILALGKGKHKLKVRATNVFGTKIKIIGWRIGRL